MTSKPANRNDASRHRDGPRSMRPRVTTAEWTLIVLLPLMLIWKWALLVNPMLTVREMLTASDWVGCFVQDILTWCVLYAIFIVPLRRGVRFVSPVVILTCNVVLLLQALDVRCKLMFLQPLTFEMTEFAVTQAATLLSSVGMFVGKTFWIWTLLSQIALNVAGPVMVKLWDNRLRPLRGAGRLIRRHGRRFAPMTAWVVSLAIVPLSAIAVTAPRQAYDLEANVTLTPLLDVIRPRVTQTDKIIPTCDQPHIRLADHLGAGPTPPLHGAASGRNVIMLIVESLRSESFPLEGDAPASAHAPFLYSFVDDGPIATRCRVQIAHSTKAIYSVLTGSYASASVEVLESQLDHIEGLASILDRAGYQTGFYSTQFLTYQNVRHQYHAMGFDEIIGANEVIHAAKRKGYEPFETSYGCEDGAFRYGLAGRLPQDRPFFAILYNASTHHPYELPPKVSLARAADLDRYHHALQYTDVALRSVLSDIGRVSAPEETLYVIVGDHGELFQGKESRARGCWLSEDEMTVPLVIALPGADAPRIDVKGARQIDILPTVIDLLGVDPGGLEVQGRSLLREGGPSLAYMNGWGGCEIGGLVEGDRKYVQHLPSGKTWWYDLARPERTSAIHTLDDRKKNELTARIEAFNQYNEARLRAELQPE